MVNIDPHHAREANRYEHPVPSREYILQYLKDRKKPVGLSHLMRVFHVKTSEEVNGITRRLKAMVRDGQLVLNRRNRYALAKQLSLIAGRVQAHRDGFGWLIPDDGGPDIFLSARQMRQVFSDDRILVRIISTEGRRSEGCIVDVLERNTERVVGRYCEESGIAFVDPHSKSITQDILITKGYEAGAKPGQFVVVKITTQPTARRLPMGEIIEILGDQLTPGMEVELAVRAHDLPFQWPQAVLDEIAQLPSEVLSHELMHRRDLRHLPFVTIDGEDARDFDDAIYCESLDDHGFKVMVAIADVTHYVKPNSPADIEAQLRGNSVYFPSRVIPMLPEKLSNELCSLRPHVDRLTMVCDMTLDANGTLKSYTFEEAVIHSNARLTYTEVAQALSGKKIENLALLPQLKMAHRIFKKLFHKRQERGAIEFETIETQILFSGDGKIDRIIPRERNVAHRIIEELMLLANETTALFLEKSELPVLYRVHDLPEESKLKGLRDFLKAFALRLTGGDHPTSKDYAKLLERVAKRSDAHLIQTVMLRSLRQAIYTSENRGHFGLSYERYCHFTSPIRRYPDVLVHRALKYVLKNKKTRQYPYDAEWIESFGDHGSMTERRADRATRDATDWLKCDYMQHKVSEVFDGWIVDVTGFGFFVELKDIYVQGLVHVSTLKNDYYQYDATHHLLRGKSSNCIYRLGDRVRVQVIRVDLNDRKIDFALL